MFETFNSSKKMENQDKTKSQNQTDDPTSNKGAEDSQDTSQNDGNENLDSLSKEELAQKLKDIEGKNKQLYERTKKAENQKKKIEAKLQAKEISSESGSEKEEKIDSMDSVFDTAKKLSALRDYNSDELDLIKRQAKALDLDPVEAAKHEDTKVLIEARREKNKKINNTPSPSNRQKPSTKDFRDWTPKDVESIDTTSDEGMKKIDEFREWARKQK